jgi:hypothetical protein
VDQIRNEESATTSRISPGVDSGLIEPLFPPTSTKSTSWDKALRGLEEKSPIQNEIYKMLQRNLSSGPDGVLEIALAIVTNHQKAMEDKEWTLPFTILEQRPKIRDCVETVFNALHAFKDLGTTVTTADPSGIAALAWGCVTMVLEVQGLPEIATFT